jgi:TolB-like protein
MILTRWNVVTPRVLSFLCVVFLLSHGVSHHAIYAQDARPRVGVLEIENRTGRETHGALADTVRQTILLTLTLLDRYEVVDQDVPRADDVAAQAAAFPVETLLWGDIALDGDGRIAITVTIFDSAEDRIVVTETETAPSLLDVFYTADTLVGSVIGAFSGRRVGFGTISLDVRGSGDFRVFLDRIVLGENVTNVERILAGEYRIRVEQELPEGYRTVLEEEIVVEDDVRVSLVIELLDVDSLREVELTAVAARLDALLAMPPGSIGALAEIDRTLARYDLYASGDPASVQVSRWYRYRVDLQREYRDLLDYRYFDDSRARFDRALPRSLLAATYALHEEVPDGFFTPDQRHVLDEMSRRNRNAFYAVMLLAADYQTLISRQYYTYTGGATPKAW